MDEYQHLVFERGTKFFESMIRFKRRGLGFLNRVNFSISFSKTGFPFQNTWSPFQKNLRICKILRKFSSVDIDIIIQISKI